MALSISRRPYKGKIQKGVARVMFHARTLWLFTFSDLKTIVIPSTLFGITNSLLASQYRLAAANPHPGYLFPVGRWLLALLWVWINLLPFAINNQRGPLAIAEDRVNKPWRPMPSGRLSSQGAKTTMLVLYLVAQLCSAYITGGLRQSLGLVLLGVWYNNFGGGDCHPLIRNAINAMGYVCFTSGALEVALGTMLPFASSSSLLQWLCIIAGIIMTTVHTQDMYDQEGDGLRGRRTVPLVIGDVPARWTIALWMLVWGAVCPHAWDAPVVVRLLGLTLAGLVGFRSLVWRKVSSDKTTFIIWNVWMCYVYLLPVCGTRK